MLTLDQPSHAECIIKHSRFVAHAAPVTNQAETLAFYESVADASATHNCWAWRLQGVTRHNDDGEPGGTAGRPILAAIENQGLDGVMLIVTRYYGGIKLGIGGLARAYGGIAQRCLAGARTVEHHDQCSFELFTPFDCLGAAHTALQAVQAERLEERHEPDGTRLLIRLRRDQVRRLENLLRDLSRDQASLRRLPDQS